MRTKQKFTHFFEAARHFYLDCKIDGLVNSLSPMIGPTAHRWLESPMQNLRAAFQPDKYAGYKYYIPTLSFGAFGLETTYEDRMSCFEQLLLNRKGDLELVDFFPAAEKGMDHMSIFVFNRPLRKDDFDVLNMSSIEEFAPVTGELVTHTELHDLHKDKKQKDIFLNGPHLPLTNDK